MQFENDMKNSYIFDAVKNYFYFSNLFLGLLMCISNPNFFLLKNIFLLHQKCNYFS